MEKAKLITAIQCQVRFQLSICVYVADFVYLNIKSKNWQVVDVKGFRTQAYKLKKKMMFSEFGIEIFEI